MMRGHCSGTMSPPSGARPSSKMSVNDCEAECPRVLTYFMTSFPRRRESSPIARALCLDSRLRGNDTSKQPLDPYAHDGRRKGRKRLDAPDRGVDVPLDRAVREDHDVDLVLALARLLLEDRVDRD